MQLNPEHDGYNSPRKIGIQLNPGHHRHNPPATPLRFPSRFREFHRPSQLRPDTNRVCIRMHPRSFPWNCSLGYKWQDLRVYLRRGGQTGILRMSNTLLHQGVEVLVHPNRPCRRLETFKSSPSSNLSQSSSLKLALGPKSSHGTQSMLGYESDSGAID